MDDEEPLLEGTREDIDEEGEALPWALGESTRNLPRRTAAGLASQHDEGVVEEDIDSWSGADEGLLPERIPARKCGGWTARVMSSIAPLFPEPIELYRFRHEYAPKASTHALTIWTLIVYVLALATFVLILRQERAEARHGRVYEITMTPKSGWDCVSISSYTRWLTPHAKRDHVTHIEGIINRVAGITPEGCLGYLRAHDPCASALMTLEGLGESESGFYNLTLTSYCLTGLDERGLASAEFVYESDPSTTCVQLLSDMPFIAYGARAEEDADPVEVGPKLLARCRADYEELCGLLEHAPPPYECSREQFNLWAAVTKAFSLAMLVLDVVVSLSAWAMEMAEGGHGHGGHHATASPPRPKGRSYGWWCLAVLTSVAMAPVAAVRALLPVPMIFYR
jgi:hypothetical protein